MGEKPNNEYFIIYSNSFYFDGVLLSFRKKQLFNISNIPNLIPFNKKSNCWIINRKQLTLKKAEKIITNNKIKKDLSDLQWYQQINLDKVFNLD
jgi:hypothetical protein